MSWTFFFQIPVFLFHWVDEKSFLFISNIENGFSFGMLFRFNSIVSEQMGV